MKITDYGVLPTAQPDDVLPIVDIHDFTQAGTGSTKKITVAGLAGLDWINVTKAPYSADPTGAADSTTAIQNAINTANAAGGGTIYYPRGTYLANGLTTYTSVAHVGGGWGSVIKQTPGAADNTYLFSVNPGSGGTSNPSQNATGITFANLQLLGNSTTDTFTEFVHLINLNAASDVTITGCLLKAWRGDAIYLGSGNSGGLERHNERIRITGNTFDGVNKNNRNAISVIDGTAIQITGNTFQNCTTSGEPGAIDLEPNGAVAYTRIRSVVIAGNTFRAVGGNVGVVAAQVSTAQASLTTPFQNIAVIGNTFESCTNQQVFYFSQTQTAAAGTLTSNILIANNTCSGGASGQRPFEFEGIKGARVEGNMFEGFPNAAFFGFNHTNCSIDVVGNTFYNCGGTDGQVLAVANMLQLTVEDNLFDQLPFDVMRFQVDGVSAGTSNTIWFRRNRTRGSGGGFSSKAAGHTLTASSNVAQFNDLSGLSSTTIVTSQWGGQPILSYSRSGAGETTALAQWRTQFSANQALTDSTTA